MIEERIKTTVRDVPDFPKPGILFKDINPIMLDHLLVHDIVEAFVDQLLEKPDAICAVESRGFFFGTLLAQRLQIPFIPIRKKGKLPGDTVEFAYTLEYGTAIIEVQRGALQKGWKVLVHDDLIATGGTISAAAELVNREGAIVSAFSFLVNLSFLKGADLLTKYSPNVFSLATY